MAADDSKKSLKSLVSFILDIQVLLLVKKHNSIFCKDWLRTKAQSTNNLVEHANSITKDRTEHRLHVPRYPEGKKSLTTNIPGSWYYTIFKLVPWSWEVKFYCNKLIGQSDVPWPGTGVARPPQAPDRGSRVLIGDINTYFSFLEGWQCMECKDWHYYNCKEKRCTYLHSRSPAFPILFTEAWKLKIEKCPSSLQEAAWYYGKRTEVETSVCLPALSFGRTVWNNRQVI